MYYGQWECDRVMASYFKDDYVGSAIEVGAANGVFLSNTKHFEDCGWNVLCVEPIEAYQTAKARKHVSTYACGGVNKDDVTFHVFDIGVNSFEALSGLHVDQPLYESHKSLIKKQYDIKVKVRTLDFIIEEANLFNRIDFVSIDTESTELDVLIGFDIGRWAPKLFVIENNHNTPECANYLKGFGYRLDQRQQINDFFVKV